VTARTVTRPPPRPAKIDTFAVVVNDGHSPNGTATVNVAVSIAPAVALVGNGGFTSDEFHTPLDQRD